MKLNEITSYNLKSQTILNESWDMLTEAQRLHVGAWEKNVWPLMEQLNVLLEADLTPQQIQDIFSNAEKVSKEQGTGLTALGKAGKVTADVTNKIKKEIDTLLKQAADSKPVANFDQQFEKLKVQLKKQVKSVPGGQKLISGVDKWADFAKDNPAKSAFIIGAMTSLLAFASGGIMSGAAIGFFLKLANNTIKGDKLSVAMAKGVKGAAVGAIAGALGDAISGTAEELFPTEVTNVFTNQDGVVDITKLDAMSGVAADQLDAEDIKELIQTRSAMEQMMLRLDSDAQEILQKQLDAVHDKIVDLGDGNSIKDSINNLQSEYGIEGRGVDVVVKSNDIDGAEDPDALADPEVGEVGTVKASYSAEELDSKMGIDAAEMDRNGWLDANKDEIMELSGMTEDDFEEMQKAVQLERAIDRAETFRGINISASNESTTFMGNTPKVIDGLEGEYVEGSTFESSVETKVVGAEGPWKAMVRGTVEGVDADGNAVFQIKDVMVGPEVFNDKMFAFMDKMEELDPENPLVKDFFDKVVIDNKSADMTTVFDTMKQDIANGVMQGAAAVAIGGALADAEVKAGAKDLDKKESRRYLDKDELHENLWDEFDMYEAGFADIMKKASQSAKRVGKQAASKLGQAGAKAVDKAAVGAQRGVAAVKKGTAAAAKELGQKVTVRKLNSMWKKMGEPTDTGSIANILADVGMNDEQIGLIGSENKVDLTPTPAGKKKAPGVVDASIDIPSFADEIKKAGLADKVKALLV